MSYENAPATKILNTNCAACRRPLVDAESVTAGLGPVCRKRHGLPRNLTPEVREAANKLVWQCARPDVQADEFNACIVELSLLGCDKLALRMSKNAGAVVITVTDKRIEIKSGFSTDFLDACKGITSRKWEGKATGTAFAFYDAYKALVAVRTAYGAKVLTRLTYKDGPAAYLNADDDRLDKCMATIASEAPPAPAAKPAPTAQHKGSPCRLRGGGWGACVKNTQPAVGDTVAITTRGGKSWLATVTAVEGVKQWGTVVETARA